MKHQSTLSSESIGLEPEKIDERKIEERVYRYVAKEHSKRALMGDTIEQAGIPTGTVDNARKLRREILQLSLAPHVTSDPKLKIKAPSRFG